MNKRHMEGGTERGAITSLGGWSVLGEDPLGVDRAIHFQTSLGVYGYEKPSLGFSCVCFLFVFKSRAGESNMVVPSCVCLFKLNLIKLKLQLLSHT